MKTKLLKLSCIAVLLFTFFGCWDDCKDCLKVNRDIDPNDNDIEYYGLRFNCNQQDAFQPMHLDLVNNFGVFGKVTMENDSVLKKLELKLIEAKNCKIYTLDIDGPIVSKSIKNENGEETGYNVHNIYLTLNLNNSDNRSIRGTITQTIPIQENDYFDFHITSNDDNIPEPKGIMNTNGELNIFTNKNTDVGKGFCFSQIIIIPETN